MVSGLASLDTFGGSGAGAVPSCLAPGPGVTRVVAQSVRAPQRRCWGGGSGSAGLHRTHRPAGALFAIWAAATLGGQSRQGRRGCKMSEHHRYRKQKGVIK